MTRLYYTVFNLIALSLIIYTGVDIFYGIARSRVIDVKTGDVSMRKIPDAEQPKEFPLKEFNIITHRNLFDSLEKASKEIKDEETENLEPTSLALALLGTVSGDQQNARAVIEETGKKTQGLYREGDSIQNAVIRRILRAKVILRVEDKDEILTMEESSSSRKDTGAPDLAPPSGDARRGFMQGAKTTESTISVKRSEIQESVKDINQLLSQAMVQPHYKDGNADGLAINRIKIGSLFFKLGLRNGDIVQGINGNPLTSPEDVLSMYENLKSGDNASLQITRRGMQRTLNYNFR